MRYAEVAMSTTAVAPGLTTSQSPFIEEARHHGQLYIHQPYELYSEENHEAWRPLYSRMVEPWLRFANPHFLRGLDSLCLDSQRVPESADWIQRQSGRRLRAGFPVFRLPAQSRISHHHHHPPLRSTRLSA